MNIQKALDYETLDYVDSLHYKWIQYNKQRHKEVTLMKYVKRPIPVEAWCIRKDDDNRPTWVRTAIVQGTLGWCDDGGMIVYTQMGKLKARPGDYIIQGVEGELYPCRASIFTATYDPVGEGD